jgi:hypothetical protein
MKYNLVEVSGHNLENSQIYKPVSIHFCSKGGVKSVSGGDCEQQGGKLVRLLSQLHTRIRPLVLHQQNAKNIL